MFEGALKSKTIWFGVALQIFSEIMLYMPQFEDNLEADTYSGILKVIGLIIIVLRIVTKVPLDQK